jgi:hypothetical protein
VVITSTVRLGCTRSLAQKLGAPTKFHRFRKHSLFCWCARARAILPLVLIYQNQVELNKLHRARRPSSLSTAVGLFDRIGRRPHLNSSSRRPHARTRPRSACPPLTMTAEMDIDFTRRNKKPRPLSEHEKEKLDEFVDAIHYSAR